MKLAEAYELMRSTSEEVANGELCKARTIVYEEICVQAEVLVRGNEAQADAIANETFLSLVNRGTPLEEMSDRRAKGFIERAVKNEHLKYYRDQKRLRKNRQGLKTNRSVAGQMNSNISEGWARDNLLDSIHFGESTEGSYFFQIVSSKNELAERLYQFLIHKVLESAVGRSDARRRARVAVEQMRDVVTGQKRFEDLIDEDVGGGASIEDRRRSRDRLHKRHQRTRDKLSEWLEKQRSRSATTTDGFQEGLTELDLTLLNEAVESLRSRRSSGDAMK